MHYHRACFRQVFCVAARRIIVCFEYFPRNSKNEIISSAHTFFLKTYLGIANSKKGETKKNRAK